MNNFLGGVIGGLSMLVGYFIGWFIWRKKSGENSITPNSKSTQNTNKEWSNNV
jgi:uncharacterized protein YneF (UPF0154 family)